VPASLDHIFKSQFLQLQYGEEGKKYSDEGVLGEKRIKGKGGEILPLIKGDVDE